MTNVYCIANHSTFSHRMREVLIVSVFMVFVQWHSPRGLVFIKQVESTLLPNSLFNMLMSITKEHCIELPASYCASTSRPVG